MFCSPDSKHTKFAHKTCIQSWRDEKENNRFAYLSPDKSSGFGVKEQGVKGFFRGWALTLLGYSGYEGSHSNSTRLCKRVK
ncbi:hypothetical protein KFK09_000309 [Dendrobium nobile]|uniref:Uncharacterized protein n=1 Tax=Dendrobium nobile TaxID=94219 RepID=A0A8T3C8I5_DENNO|nr:hypothetical protein KFK09_000309 [Dendrobium nobile]